MRIARTLPPAAVPLGFNDILSGLKGLIRGTRERRQFATDLKNHFGAIHCFLVSSGKAALTLILQALHDLHPEKDEVLIPAYTCFSVPSAIARAGLKMRLCDVDADSLDFDRQQLARILSVQEMFDGKQPSQVLNGRNRSDNSRYLPERGGSTDRLLAVIATHLYGRPSGAVGYLKTALDSDVTVIEDAAQAMGGISGGKKIGTLGHIGFFSLGRGKASSAVEGGIIITDSDDIAQRINARLINVPEYDRLAVKS